MYEQDKFLNFINENGTNICTYRRSHEIELKTYVFAYIRGLPPTSYMVISNYDTQLNERGFSTIYESSNTLRPQRKVNGYIKYNKFTGH